MGQYELLEIIGQGGMGVVYRARHLKLDKLVALKVLPSDLMRTEQAVARFEREMKAVGKITHPHIVQAYDAGEINGTHYLAMELVEGTDLTNVVKGSGPLSVPSACRMIQQTALGLAAAHQGGLVHRDIKPSNLLLAKSGQIKILDLGLARLADDTPPGETGLTLTGQVLGTPDFMAPEQWQDTHAADARADLYALGCTLHYLLMGRPPFGTEQFRSVVKKMGAHVAAPVPDLKSGRPDVPEGVNVIYHRLMAKLPADRYASAAELVAALEPFAASETGDGRPAFGPGLAVNPRPLQTARPAGAARSAWPGPWWLAVAGVTALLLLAGINQFKRRDGSEPHSQPSPGPPRVIAAAEASDRSGWHGWPKAAPPAALTPFAASRAREHQLAWANHLGVPVDFTNLLGMKFVLIPPGEFKRGSTPDEINEALKSVPARQPEQDYVRSESPPHRVILTRPFYLDVHEVTQGTFQKVMGKNPATFAATGRAAKSREKVAGLDTARHPVETVSWNEAAEFCAKLSQLEQFRPFYLCAGETVTLIEGTGYRLPTEAEWEFACRAGTTTKYWSGGEDSDLLRAGWCAANAQGRTHPVGQLQANPFGLFDVHGNVFEWVQDGWEPAFYGRFEKSPALDPTGSASGKLRLLRGGQWGEPTADCRSSNRYAHVPERRDYWTGFRVSLTVAAVRQALKLPAQPHRGPAD